MRRTLTAILLAAGFIASRPVAGAEGLSLDQVIERVQKAQDQIETLSAEITHTREIPLLEEKETMSGSLLFKKPKKLLIVFDKPELQYNLLLDQDVTVYTPSKKQVEKYRLGRAGAANVRAFGIGFMESIASVKEDFNIKLAAREAVRGMDAVKLELKPKPGEADGPYDKIEIWFDTTRWVPAMIKLSESDGEVITVILLTNVKLNRRISDGRFRLKWPKDVDVIRPLD